ncbi:MAG: hypothetical protein COA54_03800 [Thiotrichaceae bacterium]|nr:MAG: hypothetical protein COA54_03800 [Thiotrichaceae bacterium]
MEIIINQVSFNLPCKAYVVDYSVSQKRQLPVVKEFVVRLLYSVGPCKPKLLSDFYGFNLDELTYVLNDLAEERLIEWNDESVVLTKYAQEKFEEIPGGKIVPRFFEIEDEIKSVLFDHYSFKVLYSSFKPKSRNPLGIDIPLPDGSHSNIKERVKSSFDEQFSLYQEKVQNIDIYRDCPELYKINHITTNYDAILPIEVSYSIHTDNPRNIILKYNNEDIDEWDAQHVLFKAMDEALSGKECNSDDQAKGFSDYLQLTSDPFITRYWSSSNGMDIDTLINNYAIDQNIWDSKSTRMLVGNIYTKQNCSIITQMIEQKRKDINFDNKITENGAIWITEPDRKTWGRSNEFVSFVSKINERFDQRKKSTGIAMIMPCASKQEAWELDAYSFATNKNIKIQGVNEVFVSQRIEIFFIPKVIMVVLFHYEIPGNSKLTLPIGFITTNSEKMIKVNSEIKTWVNSKNIVNTFFEPNNRDQNNTVLDSIIRPTLEILDEEKGGIHES